ncbi:MAG TPA: hypothetical protein VK668_13990 [Mucilaginibacter sp.]|nr:hypothetical protein [Mucilaginibacter sp.]
MEEEEDNFVLKTVLRCGFHFLTIVLFFLASENWYFDFQSFLIAKLSKIKYANSIDAGTTAFEELIFFIIFCFIVDYLIAKRIKLKEYFIPFLLISDLICLFIVNLIMVYYNNIFFGKTGSANVVSLNNVALAILLIGLKNWIIGVVFKNRSIQTPVQASHA